jgi:lipoyl(octanoyl) transferase
MAELWVVRAGLVGYDEARRAQKALEAARSAGEIPDVALVLEHPPVYTKGRRTAPEELPMGDDWYRMQGIEVTDTDRGGRVTYHGPGQLVVYPIVSLRELKRRDPDTTGREAEEVAGIGVHAFVGSIEGAMIAALGDWGVEARLFDGLTGVWVGSEPPPAGDARKIGSIGIHVNRGITTHGLAINVNNDLQPFEWVVPCGIEAVRMTSVSRELGAEQDFDGFAGLVVERLAEAFDRDPVERSADEVLGPLALETA